MNRLTDAEVLLTPAEVAALFRVDPKTVTRWAKAGKLTSIRTLGGHRRYRESEVRELLKTTKSNEFLLFLYELLNHAVPITRCRCVGLCRRNNRTNEKNSYSL